MWILNNYISLGRVHTTRFLSSCNVIKAFSVHNYSPLNAKRYINRISPTVFPKKDTMQIQLWKGQILFCKKSKKHWFCQKVLWNWLTTYLLCLLNVIFNRHLAYLWIYTVLLFSPTFSFIRTRHTSYWGFTRKTKIL